MNHPETILRTLDGHLVNETRLIIYGRAALALGYRDPIEAFLATLDVDAILPEIEMDAIETNDSFWRALEITNEELEPSGLYMTHLFTESQVILSPSWLDHLEPIGVKNLNLLRLFRPSTADLLLTKMMRIDPQDRQDLRFLYSHLPQGFDLRGFLATARVPDIEEIREAFDINSEWLLNSEFN